MRVSSSAFLAGLTLLSSFAFASCDWMKKKSGTAAREAKVEKVQVQRGRSACASDLTYDRLKELVFDEAIKIRNADPVNLDQLATHSVLRMEEPVVVSRDAELDITVCSGRFILDLPPGAERAFDGKRRLEADVEYAAQAAADGSGLVYRMNGAEPIIYSLAAFDLKNPRPASPAPQPDQLAAAPPQPAQRDLPQPPPAAPRPSTAPAVPPPREIAPPSPPPTREARKEAEPRGAAKPSFNCRYAKTRSERMLCSDGGLAALDRSMSSLYYSALSGAPPGTRAELRRTRDRFLAYRERCSNEACVADAYRGRMQEIRDIAGR